MIIAITTMVLGGNVLFATVLAISIIGMYELYKIYDVDKKLLGFTGYTACIIYYLLFIIYYLLFNISNALRSAFTS